MAADPHTTAAGRICCAVVLVVQKTFQNKDSTTSLPIIKNVVFITKTSFEVESK